MKCWLLALVCACGCGSQETTAASTAMPVANLLQVKRIYVEQLTGDAGSFALRDLLIAGINSTGLFVMTENPDRADAILKGAADDHTFEDVFDSSESGSSHENAGRASSGSSSLVSKGRGTYGGASGSQSESHHSKERKHEAFAALRLCTRDGDVLWSTTQESLGGKFKGAGADVAAKVSRQLALDYDRARRQTAVPTQNQ